MNERSDMPAVQAPIDRLPWVGTTIFSVMSALAARHGAINLGQGFPDFDCDPALHLAVVEAMRAGHNQYAPMPGVLPLRERIASKTAALYGHRYDADQEITVTAGATQALMAAIVALSGPGDEVIVLEPCYDSYQPSIDLAGASAVRVPLDAARNYAVDWDRVRAAITPRTRLLIVNFPHNPTGQVLDAADIASLEAIVEHSGITVLSDEVYEHILFDGRSHQGIARSPLLASRGVLVSSFGKTFHATGWKVGYACAPAALSAMIRKVHQFMVFAVSTPMQHALASYLDDPTPYLDLPAFYQRKRDRFCAALSGSRFRLLPSQGTYFVLADYSSISDEPEDVFARWLIERHGVAAIPVSAFYREGYDNRVIRFCFAKREDTLDAAVDKLLTV
ncbi:MAG: methionine aminotransferase [bacterium]|jgi:methionine aminotransferase|nr:methionine aminotransferase [Betaproteobacteria bacterium]